MTFVTASDGSLPIYGGGGAAYLWPSRTRFHFETGIETTALGEGHIWGKARWVHHFSDRWRPYYSFGLGLSSARTRALATLFWISQIIFSERP